LFQDSLLDMVFRYDLDMPIDMTAVYIGQPPFIRGDDFYANILLRMAHLHRLHQEGSDQGLLYP